MLYPNASRDKARVSSKSNITRCIFDIQCKFTEKNLEKPCEFKKKNLRSLLEVVLESLQKNEQYCVM